jgi:hypothetical protein
MLDLTASPIYDSSEITHPPFPGSVDGGLDGEGLGWERLQTDPIRALDAVSSLVYSASIRIPGVAPIDLLGVAVRLFAIN